MGGPTGARRNPITDAVEFMKLDSMLKPRVCHKYITSTFPNRRKGATKATF